MLNIIVIMEMKNKIKMRCHYTYFSVAQIKKTTHTLFQMLAGLQNNWTSHTC